MSFEFLGSDGAAGAVARSPMERLARAAGARFEIRDGWSVATEYAAPADGVTWTDTSHLGKLEIQASPADLAAIVARCAGGVELEFGRASRAADAWWCPLTDQRALVLCEPAFTARLREALEEAVADAPGLASLTEVTTVYAALTLCGPEVREVFARFCALDLRKASTPVHGLRPGSVARGPGLVLREAEDRFLMLFGWALGEYMWTVVADAAGHLGGGPAGVDALAPLEEAIRSA
jgi:heterotetrameric sarcosine oxidase gamma subunit